MAYVRLRLRVRFVCWLVFSLEFLLVWFLIWITFEVCCGWSFVMGGLLV